MLHVLIHMSSADQPLTSEVIAKMLMTNAVVIRRTLGHLREQGFVESTKGHGGGWVLSRSLDSITLNDVYKAIGEPELFALGLSSDSPTCQIEKSANAALAKSLKQAEKTIVAQFKAVTLAQIAKSVKRSPHGAT
jgi:Rrf2 family protein